MRLLCAWFVCDCRISATRQRNSNIECVIALSTVTMKAHRNSSQNRIANVLSSIAMQWTMFRVPSHESNYKRKIFQHSNKIQKKKSKRRSLYASLATKASSPHERWFFTVLLLRYILIMLFVGVLFVYWVDISSWIAFKRSPTRSSRAFDFECLFLAVRLLLMTMMSCTQNEASHTATTKTTTTADAVER